MTERPFVPAARSPRNGFVFDRTGAAVPSARLDAIVDAAVELDIETLAARMLFASPRAGRTPWVGVRAGYVRTDESSVPSAAPASAAEAARLLRRALERSVEHALDGVRCAAVLTGGGLDSGALLALAHAWARRTGATVFATAIDFGGHGDDRPYLAALERHLGCDVVRVRPTDASSRMRHFDEGVDAAPLTWPGAPMEIEALARARAHGAEIVLTGIGADELFDGEPRSLARLARRHPLRALRRARALRGFERPRSPLASWILRPLVSTKLPAFVRRWRHRSTTEPLPAWAGPALIAAHGTLRAASPADASWDAPHHEHLAWLRHQEDVAAGIECRSIFLERPLRALVASLPPEWLLHGAIRRGLFREALRDLLPAVLVERVDKARFEGGFRAWLEAAGGFAHLRPLATGERLAALSLVDAAAFARAFAAFERTRDDGELWTSLWPALAVEAFLRAHAEGRWS